MMGEKIVLLDMWASSFCLRVRIALEEKGIAYDCNEENVMHKSQLLVDMNPVHKKIPVLIHNGKPVSESMIIIEYLEEGWKNKSPPLLPSDPYQRAMAKFWVKYIDNKMPQNVKNIWMKKGEEKEKAKEELIECLKTMEGVLGEKPFFGGERLGFVDVALVSFYCWFYALEICGNFSFEFECPKITGWAKRCMENESVSKSLPHPHKIYEAVLQFQKLMGIE